MSQIFLCLFLLKMKVNSSKEVSSVLGKLLLYGCCSFFAIPFLVLFLLILYVFFATIFPSSPDKEKAIELLKVMSYYDLPASSKIVYSKHYQDILSSNVCFVFKYQEGYYNVSASKFNYLNQSKNYKDKNFASDYNRNMVKNEGCSKFASKLDKNELEFFTEYDYRYQPIGSGRGLKVFVNDKDKLIMFEGYLYD